jgi:hypothetical protein
MIWKIFNSEVSPIIRHKRPKLKSVVQSCDNSNEIRKEVVEISRMKVVFAMIRRVSGPRIDSWVMGLRSVGNTIFVICLCVSVKCLLK